MLINGVDGMGESLQRTYKLDRVHQADRELRST